MLVRIAGLLFLTLFVIGLVLIVRESSLVYVLIGVSLVLMSPLLFMWLSPFLNHRSALTIDGFKVAFRSTVSIVVPLLAFLLLFVIAARIGDHLGRWGFLIAFLVLIGLVNILIEIANGEREFDLVEISQYWSKHTLYLIGLSASVVIVVAYGAVFLLIGSITMISTVFDSLNYLFGSSGFNSTVCSAMSISEKHCGVFLVGWHTINVIAVGLFVRYYDAYISFCSRLLNNIST